MPDPLRFLFRELATPRAGDQRPHRPAAFLHPARTGQPSQGRFRLKILGDHSAFRSDVARMVDQAVEKTAGNSKPRDRANYGARTELAAARAAADGRSTGAIERALDTHDLPPLDLLIRTSGSTAFQFPACRRPIRILFVDTLADFDGDALRAALNDYARRERRYEPMTGRRARRRRLHTRITRRIAWRRRLRRRHYGGWPLPPCPARISVLVEFATCTKSAALGAGRRRLLLQCAHSANFLSGASSSAPSRHQFLPRGRFAHCRLGLCSGRRRRSRRLGLRLCAPGFRLLVLSWA